MSAGDPIHPPVPPRIPSELDATDLALGVLEEDARLEDVHLAGTAPPDTVAPAASVAGARMTGSLAGCRLPALHLTDVEAAGVDFANVAAPKSGLRRVVLRDCRLTGAQLAESGLRDVTLSGCRLDLAVLAGATLERVVFADCVLADASLEQSRLRDVRFERCDLTGATLTGIRLERVALVGCRLAEVRHVTDLRGARLPWPDLVEHAGALAGALGIEVLEDD